MTALLGAIFASSSMKQFEKRSIVSSAFLLLNELTAVLGGDFVNVTGYEFNFLVGEG